MCVRGKGAWLRLIDKPSLLAIYLFIYLLIHFVLHFVSSRHSAALSSKFLQCPAISCASAPCRRSSSRTLWNAFRATVCPSPRIRRARAISWWPSIYNFPRNWLPRKRRCSGICYRKGAGKEKEKKGSERSELAFDSVGRIIHDNDSLTHTHALVLNAHLVIHIH